MPDDIEAFADKIADYMGTRVTPWLNPTEMRAAVHEAMRLTFTEAVADPDNPYQLLAVQLAATSQKLREANQMIRLRAKESAADSVCRHTRGQDAKK